MTDDNDSKILSLLKNDGRMSFVDIAKQIGLTEGAVRARVSKLIKQGTIRHFTVDTKDDVKAVVSVATSRAMSTTAVADSIRKLGVDRVYEISGNYDILCLIESNSIEEVNATVEKIRALEGVTDTSTSMVLK
ncbi:MAG: Lrp/AsnC family transcriptional regulator [Candidatus Micrarchaeota archaeon]|nr:Lrp/AsnC family transcriptional regulator [Candidatus Micrarchaeota archaeon]MDE1860056.1 Lrp/AsnC family transcriptional regulator [Candidatus Micrarchaeota archaeon]